jgi:glycerol-3-phosphate acyltransferase PlsX
MRRRTTVVLDTCGGHGAPTAVIRAAARQGVANIILVGDLAVLQGQLSLLPYDPTTLRLVPAPVGAPRTGDTRAWAQAAAVALPIAMQLLVDGEADALVTASPPELVEQLAALHLPKLPHVDRLYTASVFPTVPRKEDGDPLALLLDVSGRRVQNAAELVQMAELGSTYARIVTGEPQPAVALLSTGPGALDGPPEVQAAHAALQVHGGLRFVGNLRPTDLARGYADVVVTDGLVGHAVRGMLEGLTSMAVEAARYAWKTKVTWRVALRLLAQGVGMLRKVSEFQAYGGAPLLGLQHLVLVAHEDSGEQAFDNAIRLAARCQSRDLQPALDAAMRAMQRA